MTSKQQKKKNTQSKEKSTSNNKETWIILGILLCTFAAFFPSLQNGFVNWDDKPYIVENSLVRDLSFHNIAYLFKFNTYVMANYHPLTMLTYCLEFHFFKLNPVPYHLDNIILHLLNVILVYVFVKMLLTATSGEQHAMSEKNTAIHSTLVPAITALLFGIHPLRVESVTWVAERKDVLYTFFFLASLCCYVKYIQFNTKQQTPNNKLYISSLAFFVLSLFSKGQAVVLSPILLLIDIFTKRRLTARMFFEKIPFLALSGAFGIVAMRAQKHSFIGQSLVQTLWSDLLTASYGIVMYVYKLIIPIPLACYYSYPQENGILNYASPVIVIILLVGVSLLAYKMRNKNGKLSLNQGDGQEMQSSKSSIIQSILSSFYSTSILFGFLFFLITVSVVLLPVGGAIISERYTYVPYIGLFFIIAALLNYFAEKSKKRKSRVLLPAAAYGCLLFIFTYNYTKAWKSSETLWKSVLEHFPEDGLACNNLGEYYFEKKQFDIGIPLFLKAIKYKKGYYAAMLNCGLALDESGKPDSALYYYKMAAKGDTINPRLYYTLGLAYKKTGNLHEALKNYNRAIVLNSKYDEAYNNRANVYYLLGDCENAIKDYSRSIEINPGNATTYANRSIVCYKNNDFKQALDDALAAQSFGYNEDERYVEMLKAQSEKK